MKYVVKLGGAGLEIPELLQGCVRAIADLVRDGNQVAVVHGGGVQLTSMMERLGAKSEFMNGLRVTDAETREYCADGVCGQGEQRLGGRAGCAGSARGGHDGRRWIAVSRAEEADRAGPGICRRDCGERSAVA